jgi:hypothetical protein
MDISNKTGRSTLKGYFAKNTIPTAGNFADLIDGVLNQREDGIVKLPGEPLSIQADPGSQNRAINFYRGFSDPKATWTLSLNPWGDPGALANPTAGFSIGDVNGNSRLFIDETTGNVGVGTVDTGTFQLTVPGAARFSSVSIGTTDHTRTSLDIAQVPRTLPPNHPASVNGLYVTGDFSSDANGVEFRHSNGSQGIGFGYNTIYATGSNPTQDLNLKPKGGSVNVAGSVLVAGGDLKADGFTAPVATERLFAIRGIVGPNGAVSAGAGFTVTRLGTGLSDVKFDRAFAAIPSVVVTQIFSGDPNSAGGDTRDNAVVVGITTDRVRVKTGDGAGAPSDRFFAFIAMGPR